QRMIRCEGCSHGLYAELHKGHIYYRCQSKSCPKTSLREDAIVQKIAGEIGMMGLSANTLQAFGAMFRLHIEGLVHDLPETEKALQLALAQIDTRAHRLTDAYLDRVLDRDAYEARK